MSQIIMAKAIVSGEIEHRLAQWWVPGIVLCPFCGIAIEARGEGCACGASILPHAPDRFTESWDNARRDVTNHIAPLIDTAGTQMERLNLMRILQERLADIDREYEAYWRQCNRSRTYFTPIESPDMPILQPPRLTVEELSERRRRAWIDMAIAARDALMGIDTAEGQDEYVQRLTELPEPPQSNLVLESLSECTRRWLFGRADEELRPGDAVVQTQRGFIRALPKAEADEVEAPEPGIDCPECGGKTQALGRGDYFCLDCEWDSLEPKSN